MSSRIEAGPGPGSLAERRRQPEVMDQPDLDPTRHREALRGLARLNAWSGSPRILWPEVRRLARETGGRVTMLDVATGGGDVPVGLARLADRAGVDLDVEGCDRSATALDFARRTAAGAGLAIPFFERDALDGRPLGSYDVVACSLFLHHLDEDQALELLRRMAQAARRLVLVNDLTRGRPGFALAWAASRVLTGSDVVHVDGPRSVEGAFTRTEAADLARRAGLTGATVQPRFPCRWLLAWRRP